MKFIEHKDCTLSRITRVVFNSRVVFNFFFSLITTAESENKMRKVGYVILSSLCVHKFAVVLMISGSTVVL